MARYLLASSPLHGHVMPMLTIAADLARRGHEVRLLTGARFAAAVARAGVEHVVLPPGADYEDRGLNSTAPRRDTRGLARARLDVDLLVVDSLAAQYRALTAALDDDTDAVLVESGFSGAVPLLLAGADRPPVVAVGVVPLMLSSRDAPPFGMARTPRGRGPFDRLQHRVMNALVTRVLFRANQARADGVLRELGLGPLPTFLTEWPRLADRMLQLTVAEFEYPRSDLPASVTFAGPVLAPRAAAGEVPDWWHELDAGRPVVHVTQGTFDTGDLGRLVGPVCAGLAGEDVLVVVSTGGRPVSAVPGPLPATVRVAEYLPYDDLLPHVDVMVTNGGYGGVHHALSHGVPLVVAGDAEENPEIAARVSWCGAGVDLRTGTPRPDEVRRAVRAVLDGGSHTAGARRLRRAITAARPLDAVADALASTRPSPVGPSPVGPSPAR